MNVSVVIPTFNGARYIGEAIESALGQTVPVFEIIVVDDGSTDNTVDIVSTFGERITLVQKKNGGAASAYNLGIKSVTGDTIAFLEHDDIWLPEKNEAQLDALNSLTDVGLLFSTAQVLTIENSSKSDVRNLHTGQGYYSFSDFFLRNRILNCSTVILRREVLRNTGSFNENLRLGFDHEMWLRMALNTKIFCLDLPLSVYRIHESNLSQDRNDLQSAEATLQILRSFVDNAHARQSINRRDMTLRIVETHCEIAWYYAKAGNRSESTAHLKKALSADPTNMDVLQKVIASSFIGRWLNGMIWSSKRIFNKL